MRKVILSEKEQIKCNFCTKWFTVFSDFATIQRYSLNACQKCFANFKYQLINPQTYQIYHVLLLNTGYKLTNKDQQLDQIFHQLLQEYENKEAKKTLHKYDTMLNKIHHQTKQHIAEIKEKVSSVCEKLVQNLLKNWQQVVNNFDSFGKMIQNEKERKIQIISEKNYDFAKDPEKLLDEKKNMQIMNIFKDKKQALLKIDETHLLKKIMNTFETNEKIDKENIPPLKLLNKYKSVKTIRTLREGVVNKKEKAQNQKMYERKRTLSRSVIGGQEKEDRETSCNRSNRSHSRIILGQNIQTYKQPNIMDQYRSQVIHLIKEKQTYQSYIPPSHIEVNKPSEQNNKIWGQKSMIENIVQLKLKSLVNENQFQLINENLSGTNISCFLKSLDWQPSISIIKLVKASLNDEMFDDFLHWLSTKQSIQTLVLTNNHLTEMSVKALLGFIQRHRPSKLKQIYLGNNYIKSSKVKHQIQALRQRHISIYA